MAKRLLESLNGVGAIHGDDVLLRTAAYTLSLWSDDTPTAPGETPKVVAIDGHIDITGIAEAVVMAGPDQLTLTLEDGRRLTFQLTSSSGSIVGHDWVR
jgi:hypothetical protein